MVMLAVRGELPSNLAGVRRLTLLPVPLNLGSYHRAPFLTDGLKLILGKH